MASIAKENEISTAPTPATPAVEAPGRTQAVALELLVSVNGARTVEGSEKREPFSESTKTVLVFGNGAVIRLTSPVAPGQLLFLTNEKTKKEVVCQVVKSKNYRNVSGYVELEFTEPVVGFWGMRFPSDRVGAQPPAGATPATQQIPVAVVAPKVPVAEAPRTDAAANFNALKALASTLPATNTPSSVKPPVEAPQKNPIVSVPSRPAASDASSEALKLQATRLQEELSSMLFEERAPQTVVPEAPVRAQEVHETAANILEFVKPEPLRRVTQTPVAPAAAELQELTAPLARLIAASNNPAPLLDEEEVKIPSWLEPLARNAATASAAELPAVKEEQRQKEPKLFGGSLVTESLADTAPTAAEADTTPFGSSFLASDETVVTVPAGSSNKGILIGTVAAGLLLAAAGLTWYLRNQRGEQKATARPAITASAPVQAPVPGPVQGLSTASAAAPATSGAPAAGESSSPATTLASSNSASASMNNAVSKSAQPAVPPATHVEVPPTAKKPALGAVRLAAPKVNGSGAKLPTDEPGITLNGTESAPAGTLGEFAASNSKQPVAPVEPLPVGGDVRPAKLLSSVSPLYPQLAKSQHVSGDVKVDALIDTNGRVTTMKVVAGPTLLHQAAMDALRQWRYQAATLDGKPVPMHLTVTLQFRLQ